MKLRCDLSVNGGFRKLLIVPGPSETGEHLALKLAGFLLFWDFEPQVEVSAKHPALTEFEFMPDVLALQDDGSIRIWVECGKTTMNKMLKLTRRLPHSRIVVLKETEAEAQRLRRDLTEELERSERIEILAFPGAGFKEWYSTLAEKNEVYGEADPLSLNLVINNHAIHAELRKF